MEKEENAWRGHVLVLPFPSQGHINPMLQFSKRLSSKGLKATLAITLYASKSMQVKAESVSIESFSDGYDQGGIIEAGSFEAYSERFEAFGSINLAMFIEKQNGTKYPIKCLIFDAFIPWALDFAKRLGLIGAPFFTQSCAVDSIYYHLQRGSLSINPLQGTTSTVSFPGLPLLQIHELPSFVYDKRLYPTMLGFFLNQFSKIDQADCIFFNTFDKLEDEVVTWMAKQWSLPTMTIGPNVPSICQDEDYSLNLIKPDLDACMKWLNMKPNRSVVYISFGSIVFLGAEQMEELVWGLRQSNNYYLCVTKASEDNKLAEETSAKGLVVSWCPQLKVLAHQAVGCFITHCGWNSTLEALSLGVPMVAMPQFTDQNTNAKFVEDVWRVGIRAKADEKGIVRREEIQHCVREVMNGERAEEMKKNSERWKELAKEAVSEGGSSAKNIDEFVARLVCTSS